MTAGPASPDGSAGWRAVLADPGRALVACDFDGTLAPIVSDPAQAYAHPDAGVVLARLGTVIGVFAVVTGRPAEVVLRLADLRRLPGLVILGQYGVERWEGGTLTAPPSPPGVAAVRSALPELLAELGVSGARLEDKGRAVAVHVRSLPEPGEALERLRGPLERLADRHGLVVEPGRLVLELRAPGMDKGRALRDLVRERHPSALVYAGDDLGDLAAYDAVDELRRTGTPGILVCAESTEQPALAARADVVVDGPDGVVGWLGQLADVLGAERLNRQRPGGCL